MKHERLEVLDIEETSDGDGLEVVFEVPGDRYDQSYPKRLSHVFPKRDKFLSVVDEEVGERRFEMILKDLYLEDERVREERGKVDDKLDSVRDEFCGKCFER